MGQINNVFISHHHKDDNHVDKLTELLGKNGCLIRNSSIRAKPANQAKLNKGLIKDSVIRRLLRMKISWAGAVIVLVGKETHKRKWVNWEIEEALKRGKKIIGVYENGLKEKVKLPDALDDSATSIVGWNSTAIIDAINGAAPPTFQNPDGSLTEKKAGAYIDC
nr:TIR domain-containing protein [Geomonas sp. Red32]